MTTAIAKREEQELTIPTQRGILTTEVLREAAEQRKLLGQYVREQLIEGTDYGTIPGTEKKDKDGNPVQNRTLLKPGAEKLVDLFRCTPKFTLVKSVEDFDRGLFAYTFRVRLLQRDAQVVLAEGFGSANSREGRYRWRQGSRKCPACTKETIIRGKAEYGGGWICFQKKGGCGQKFMDGEPQIISQEIGRVENDDIASQANAILKVAKKRALVDGALALARVSDLFTQDMEEHVVEEENGSGRSTGRTPGRNPGDAGSTPAHSTKPAGKHNGKKPAVWQGVLALAHDYGFDTGGPDNMKLWAFCDQVLNKKPAKDWSDLEYQKMEKALAEAVKPRVPDAVLAAAEPQGPSGVDDDIPF